LLPLDDDPEELDEPESESESEEDESALANASISAYFFSSNSFGASFKNSRKSSVRAPSPIEVKKLIEKRAFCTESRGNRPSKCYLRPFSAAALSEMRSTRFYRPRLEATSYIKILTKIRDEAVVVSSVSVIELRGLAHEIESVYIKCAKKQAAFLSFPCSNLWTVSYYS
jgi:hypothetical protein